MIGMAFSEVVYFKTAREGFLAEKRKPFSFVKSSTGKTAASRHHASGPSSLK
jgi:hypothetical protein